MEEESLNPFTIYYLLFTAVTSAFLLHRFFSHRVCVDLHFGAGYFGLDGSQDAD